MIFKEQKNRADVQKVNWFDPFLFETILPPRQEIEGKNVLQIFLKFDRLRNSRAGQSLFSEERKFQFFLSMK